MTGEFLDRLCRSAGIHGDNIIVRDNEYLTLDPAWVFGEFGEFYPKWRQQEKLPPYVPESNDCDDFAADAVFILRKIHRVKGVLMRKEKRVSIAFGICDYLRDSDSQSHEVNIFVGNNPETQVRTIYHFEPQAPRSKLTLSARELSTCLVIF